MGRRTVCAEPGCPNLTTKTRCERCTRERDRARGTRQQRGYDADYDRSRRAAAPIVATGSVTCWRCGKPIQPGTPWTWGHCDDDRAVIHGAEHRACGLATEGRTQCSHPTHRRRKDDPSPQGGTPTRARPQDSGCGVKEVRRVKVPPINMACAMHVTPRRSAMLPKEDRHAEGWTRPLWPAA